MKPECVTIQMKATDTVLTMLEVRTFNIAFQGTFCREGICVNRGGAIKRRLFLASVN